MQQVHQQEGEVVEGVDRRQRLVELQAVEQHRRAVQQDDVAEVQIAVAVAHEALGAAPLEHVARALERGPGRLVDRTHLSPLENRADQGGEVAGIAPITSAMAAWPPRSGRRSASSWKAASVVARASIVAVSSACASAIRSSSARLVEPPHLEQPLDRLALAIQGQRAALVAGDRQDALVEHRRGAAVEAQLGVQRVLASLQRREVEEAVAHRALHLVGALADQKNLGRVGLTCSTSAPGASPEKGAEPVRIDRFSAHAPSLRARQCASRIGRSYWPSTVRVTPPNTSSLTRERP